MIQKYNVSGVPKIVVNETIEFVGAQPAEVLPAGHHGKPGWRRSREFLRRGGLATSKPRVTRDSADRTSRPSRAAPRSKQDTEAPFGICSSPGGGRTEPRRGGNHGRSGRQARARFHRQGRDGQQRRSTRRSTSAVYTKGKYALLFFYPLDFTFVCPTEILAFDHRLEEFKERNVEVIGVSVDSQFTHLAWKNTPVEQGGLGHGPLPARGRSRASRSPATTTSCSVTRWPCAAPS